MMLTTCEKRETAGRRVYTNAGREAVVLRICVCFARTGRSKEPAETLRPSLTSYFHSVRQLTKPTSTW